ncbi:pilus assembly protein CpaB [Limimonas halophila]|uniref:Pilus assembly protein CpaB n=1 Tax=Limimonas halophila TaxID=1082479 RepID=A0A1G7PCP6_9PROT|nr:Flp pilus assembly protein CpaB [Limimonas halophila]SDF83389.1 pilus assembly protein CpaB [Limimonas halophila]
MRIRLILLLTIALGAASGAAYLTQSWLNAERAARAEVKTDREPEQPTVQVLVATKDLSAGRILKDDDLRWQAWPEGGLSDSYMLKSEKADPELEGTVLRRSLPQGTPVTDKIVVRPGDRGFLAAMLGEGMRAVSVPVDAAAGLAGLVYPGDHVDVILTHEIDKDQANAKADRRASETVLSDIRVLALDQRTADDEGKRTVAKTATLEVTPRQAERISLAKSMGTLKLSLRPVVRDGETPADDASAIAASQMSGFVHVPSRASDDKHEVSVIRGDKAAKRSFETGS